MILQGDRDTKYGTGAFAEDGIRMKQHNKLVRDKIPEIIEKSGKTAVIHILGDTDYIKALETKLNEEAEERGGFQNRVYLEAVTD